MKELFFSGTAGGAVNCNRQVLLASIAAALGMALFNPGTALSQRTARSTPLTPTPASCELSVQLMRVHAGSKPYLRLLYVIRALGSAQESVEFLGQSIKDSQSADSPTTALAAVLTGTDQAIDALHCAAAIMNKYSATDEGDKNVRFVMVSAFNLEAEVIADTKSHIKERFLHSSKPQTAASTLRDAERMSANSAIQDKAASDILEVATYAFMRSVDLSDPKAKNTELLTLSCAESSDLMKENAPLAQGKKSAYSDAAGLIQEALEGHKCRQ